MSRQITRSVIGALSIVFGTILANNINHTYLSPLTFSLGIIFVIILNLGLITRSVPSGEGFKNCGIILIVNIAVAIIAGLSLRSCGSFPTIIKPALVPAIGTGIIIGLVSVANIKKTNYTVPVTFMLMFSFVYLKIPHCVVCAFYYGASPQNAIENMPGLLVVIVGNIIGGLIIRYLFKICNALSEEKE
ncbi:MAG: hypothetical protein KHY12_04900 [Firmicutes bacterium]|nr:hypothetical protein [Bacillota bacterium]